MHAKKTSHQALVGFSCFAPLVFHFLAFFCERWQVLFVRLLVGKMGLGEGPFF